MDNLTRQVTCKRCPRVEHVPITLDDAVKRAKSKEPPTKALEIKVDGQELATFDELCGTCKTIVSQYLDKLSKPQKHISALRGTSVEVVEG